MGLRRTASGAKLMDLIRRGVRFCAGGESFAFGDVVHVPGMGTFTVLDRGDLAANQIDIFRRTHAQARAVGRSVVAATVKSTQKGRAA